jgi:integrase/recombinase XerC
LTRLAYQGELKRFAAWLGAQRIGDVIEALCHAERLDPAPRPTLRMLERYRDALYGDGAGKRSSTVMRSIATLNSCLNMCDKAGIGPGKQAVTPVASNVTKGSRAGPRVQTVSAILAGLERSDTAAARRDYAIVSLLARCGLRRGEVVGLDLEDFDPGQCKVRILGKGRRVKEWVPISAPVCEAITRWIEVRSTIARVDEAALFVVCGNNARGRRIGGLSVANLVAKASDGVARQGEVVRPHGLRHTAITTVLDRCADIRVAQHFARHASPTTTIAAYDDGKERAAQRAVDILAEAF